MKLFECRPHWQNKYEWIKTKVARFKRDPVKNNWALYCADRNGKWHLFEPNPLDNDIEKLLNEVDKDSTGIFWG